MRSAQKTKGGGDWKREVKIRKAHIRAEVSFGWWSFAARRGSFYSINQLTGAGRAFFFFFFKQQSVQLDGMTVFQCK